MTSQLTVAQLAATIAVELGVPPVGVERAVSLLDEGNTIPFIARYRKEATSGLDEEQLRTTAARLDYLRNLAARKQTVLETIESQNKLTDELRRRIEAAQVLQEVEDLYLPYRPRRRTRATRARELGLEPLAVQMRDHSLRKGTPDTHARAYLGGEVHSVEEALAGARDIVAEEIAEDADARAYVRGRLLGDGVLACRQARNAQDPQGKYRMYHEYRERLAAIPPHRLLAIRRGENEGVLSVDLEADDDDVEVALRVRHAPDPNAVFAGHLALAIEDGYRRLLRPAIEREVRGGRLEMAEAHAIRVFSANLRGLLLQAPLREARVLGIDPGFRTGCKVVALDETGKVLATDTIYPHEPQRRRGEALERLTRLIEGQRIGVVAIGNGTGSRETEALVADLIAAGSQVAYVMVSEAGASVYSASRLAGAELPGMDVSMRGAVSIARRLQDPLSELVKIEPQAIGVGLYQHDVDQKALGEALDAVVESAVNHVGVDANTASPALLRYVAGIRPAVAEAIVGHRDAAGAFASRAALRKVKGLGDKAYEQAAGFLRVRGGREPLDNTAIHPESYGAARALLGRMGLAGREPDLAARVRQGWAALQARGESVASLAGTLGVGGPTLEDIVANLLRPGRDPREDLPAPILRTDILRLEDLQEGMRLKGTVRNVVDFGAFVDIGVKQDGLVHVSELADRYVSDPLDVVAVGQVVEVRVLSVDAERGRIALSMR